MSNTAKSAKSNVTSLIAKIKSCTTCTGLPLGPNPIFQFSSKSKILIAGQAPGRITHHKGIPFDDPSGNRLREWLGVDREQFYNPDLFAIVPMGFCFPGSKKGGDLPPRMECQERWRNQILDQLSNIELTLVIGKYAMDWHLGDEQDKTLAQTVQNWKHFWPDRLPMPHPSPRNGIWLKKNPWFEKDILPPLRRRIKQALKKV